RREVLGRPPRQIDIDLSFVLRDRQRLLLPGKRRVGHDDRHLGKVDGYIVQIDRIAVLQADAAARAGALPDSRLAGVKQGRKPSSGDYFVERVQPPVVRVVPTRRWVK